MESKICRNCGFAFDEGDLCPICGASFDPADKAAEAVERPDSTSAPDEAKPEASAKRKMPPYLRTAVMICAIICAVNIACTAVLGVLLYNAKNELLTSKMRIGGEPSEGNAADYYNDGFVGEELLNYSLDFSKDAVQEYKYGSVSLDKVTKKIIDEENDVVELNFVFTLTNSSEDKLSLDNTGFQAFPMYAYISSYSAYSYSSYSLVAFNFGENGNTLTLGPGESETINFLVAGGSPEGELESTVSFSMTLSGSGGDGKPFTLYAHGFTDAELE